MRGAATPSVPVATSAVFTREFDKLSGAEGTLLVTVGLRMKQRMKIAIVEYLRCFY